MDENSTSYVETKFCKECGQKVAKKAVICPHCGCQIEETAANTAAPQIVINNSNQNQNQNNNNMGGIPVGARLKRKWVAFFLCVFFGYIGAHKFYEGNIGTGLIYAFTLGLFGFGWFFSALNILGKPDPYYVF